MRHVPRAALYHAPRSVEVHPQEKAEEGQLEVVTDLPIGQNLEQFRDAENGLTNGLDVPILTLQIHRRFHLTYSGWS